MSSIVTSAISHLKELERNMRLQDKNFKNEDIENCDRIAELLQELESEVKKLHEELEAETIKTSAFRHKMTFFNYDFNKEIEENVQAARESNMAVIINLKDKLSTLTQSIAELNEKDKMLSTEIAKIQPEKKTLESTYETIVSDLNKKMAEKAAAQIVLNETRDVLRDINQATLELEEDMIALKEKLIKEKADARDEKARLEDEKQKTTKKAVEQEDANQNTNREVEGVLERLQSSNNTLRAAFRENEKLQHSVTQALLEIQESNTSLAKTEKDLENVKQESQRLNVLEIKVENDYKESKANTIKRTEDSVTTSKNESERLKVLKLEQDSLRDELKAIYEKFNQLQASNQELSELLQALKKEISEKTQQITEIESRNNRIYKDLNDAQSSHTQVMDSLQREIEECKEQLVHEKETRLKKQKLREDLLINIEILQGNVVSLQHDMAKYNFDSKSKDTMLSEREKECTERIEHNRIETKRLESEVETANKNFNHMKAQLEDNFKKLEQSIAFYENENDIIAKELTNITPEYQDLCKLFDETCHDYESVKKEVIEVKAKKHNLEMVISNLNKKTNDHENSRNKLETTIKEKRKETLDLMKKQNFETLDLEDKILQTGLKVDQIKKENDRFIKAIQDFEAEYKYVEHLTDETIHEKQILLNEYRMIQEQLLSGWSQDEDLTNHFEKDDLDLAKKLNKVMGLAKTREAKLNVINIKLFTELDKLDGYLLGMSNEPPTKIDLDELSREIMAIEDANKQDEKTERSTRTQQGEARSHKSSSYAATDLDDPFYILPEYDQKSISEFSTIVSEKTKYSGRKHNHHKDKNDDEEFIKLPYYFTKIV